MTAEPSALVAGAYERLVRQLIKEHKRPAIERLARQTKQVFERGLLSAETRALLDRPVMKSERRARNGTPASIVRRSR